MPNTDSAPWEIGVDGRDWVRHQATNYPVWVYTAAGCWWHLTIGMHCEFGHDRAHVTFDFNNVVDPPEGAGGVDNLHVYFPLPGNEDDLRAVLMVGLDDVAPSHHRVLLDWVPARWAEVGVQAQALYEALFREANAAEWEVVRAEREAEAGAEAERRAAARLRDAAYQEKAAHDLQAYSMERSAVWAGEIAAREETRREVEAEWAALRVPQIGAPAPAREDPPEKPHQQGSAVKGPLPSPGVAEDLSRLMRDWTRKAKNSKVALQALVGDDFFQGIEDNFPSIASFNPTPLSVLLSEFWWRVEKIDEWLKILVQQEQIDIGTFEVLKEPVVALRGEVKSIKENLVWWFAWHANVLLEVEERIGFCAYVDSLWDNDSKPVDKLQLKDSIELAVLAKLEEKFHQANAQLLRIGQKLLEYRGKGPAERSADGGQTKKLQKIVIEGTRKKLGDVQEYLAKDKKILLVLQDLVNDFHMATFELEEIYGQ